MINELRKGTNTHRNGHVIAASQLSDLSCRTEARSHDNGLDVVLLVVVEDRLNTQNARVLGAGVLSLVRGFVEVEDTSNEWRDQKGLGLASSNGLWQGEEEGKVAVDLVLGLQLVDSLNALWCAGNLDEDAFLVDAVTLVQLLWD